MKTALLYGGGGHAKGVLECLWSVGVLVTGFFDDDPAVTELCGVHSLGTFDPALASGVPLLVAIGDNATRYRVVRRLEHASTVVSHASALLSTRARLDEGTVVFHRAVVQSGARVGRHVIVNTAAVVEHDCVLADFVHAAPGAILCGRVRVDEGTLVGAGATVLPGVSIGRWCIVGAGAVVTRSLPDFSVAIGMPARVVRKNGPADIRQPQ